MGVESGILQMLLFVAAIAKMSNKRRKNESNTNGC